MFVIVHEDMVFQVLRLLQWLISFEQLGATYRKYILGHEAIYPQSRIASSAVPDAQIDVIASEINQFQRRCNPYIEFWIGFFSNLE